VCLEANRATCGGKTWSSGWRKRSFTDIQVRVEKETPMLRWLWMRWIDLLDKVEYWYSFFLEHRIRLHYDCDLFTLNIPKCIAIELLGGIQAGKQRSDIKMNELLPVIRDVAYHVYFVWNRRVMDHGTRFSGIDSMVVSGYYDNHATENEKIRINRILKSIKDHGARFTVALFDNVFGPDIIFTKEMMRTFYEKFIRWMEDDPQVGLILKPKKVGHFSILQSESTLIRQIGEHNRCRILHSSDGLMSYHLGSHVDMTVGIGISSAVTEAVISGGRGVHCDLPKQKEHTFYLWGFERLIFNDIDRLIAALKKLKSDPESNTHLGSWDEFMDLLDPFRDGRGRNRIGTCLTSLMKDIDRGLGRKEIFQQSLDDHRQKWGEYSVLHQNTARSMH
jgi:hypothetical protein